MRNAPEQDIQNSILRRFATTDWLRLWRINTGVYLTPDGRRHVRTAPTGHPDLAGILPRGRAFYIETKARNGRATTEQLAFAKMLARYGGLHVFAKSVDDVERVLRLEGYGEYL